MQKETILNFQPLYAEEIRDYFMDHLQAKDESGLDGVEGAPDPEDLASQVDGTQRHAPHHFCQSAIERTVHNDTQCQVNGDEVSGKLFLQRREGWKAQFPHA